MFPLTGLTKEEQSVWIEYKVQEYETWGSLCEALKAGQKGSSSENAIDVDRGDEDGSGTSWSSPIVILDN